MLFPDSFERPCQFFFLKRFGSSVIIHETMHSFGYEGNMDHYGTDTCDTYMASSTSGRPYNPDTWDLAEFQYYNGMCPYVYDNFVSAYQP